MKKPTSLQARLALAIGFGISVLWIATALVTTTILRHDMNKVFDSTLEETAQRILPLAALDIINRDEEGIGQRIATLRPHEEFFTYLVRDDQGRVLLRSHKAKDADFPPFNGMGFRQTATHRLYYDVALRGTITIAVAEPLSHRTEMARETLMALMLPLLFVVPVALLGILVVLHRGLRPIRRYSFALSTRGADDLTAVANDELPSEMTPIVQAINQLLERLRRSLEAERSFAANAAHELRTPVAAALAQTQRLIVEADDPATKQRATDIETALKRLNRLSEKLLQLARAEGGRLRTAIAMDVRPVLRMIVADLDAGRGRITLEIPAAPVLSDIDPDAFAVLSRNLIENALKHGANKTPVRVILTDGGLFRVVNDGPLVPADELERLTARFERGQTISSGSGLGLAIARAIADGVQGTLVLHSPAVGLADGFEAVFQLPKSHDV